MRRKGKHMSLHFESIIIITLSQSRDLVFAYEKCNSDSRLLSLALPDFSLLYHSQSASLFILAYQWWKYELNESSLYSVHKHHARLSNVAVPYIYQHLLE